LNPTTTTTQSRLPRHDDRMQEQCFIPGKQATSPRLATPHLRLRRPRPSPTEPSPATQASRGTHEHGSHFAQTPGSGDGRNEAASKQAQPPPAQQRHDGYPRQQQSTATRQQSWPPSLPHRRRCDAEAIKQYGPIMNRVVLRALPACGESPSPATWPSSANRLRPSKATSNM